MRCHNCGNLFDTSLLPGSMAKCPNCLHMQEVPREDVGSTTHHVQDKSLSQTAYSPRSKYGAMRTMAGLLRVFAVLVGIVAALGVIGGIVLAQDPEVKIMGITGLLSSLVVGALGIIIMLAQAQIIDAVLDIETTIKNVEIVVNKFKEKP